jgi:cell division protein FtsI (penicillin-binding protein 3)
MPFIDSARSGYWRSLQLKNNSGILNTPVISTSTSEMVTPDVVGLGLKDAVYLLENKGLKVTATGRGRVVNQSMAAGTNFNKTQTISLILN